VVEPTLGNGCFSWRCKGPANSMPSLMFWVGSSPTLINQNALLSDVEGDDDGTLILPLSVDHETSTKLTICSARLVARWWRMRQISHMPRWVVGNEQRYSRQTMPECLGSLQCFIRLQRLMANLHDSFKELGPYFLTCCKHLEWHPRHWSTYMIYIYTTPSKS
jgi:hypothetical protein